RSCTGNAQNFFGELFDRHLARVADVDRLVEIGLREFENAIDQIAHITERARLRAVPENGEGFVFQSLADERRNDAAVAQTHARTVSVEDAHNFRVDL